MGKVYENIALSLDRADALLAELLKAYDQSLTSKTVSGDAVERTHDICQKLRDILDRTTRRYWDKHVAPRLSDQERAKAKVYFPITNSKPGFDSMMGKWQWRSVRDDHQSLYDYFLKRQPFSSSANNWLAILDDLAIQGKHIDLVPQKRTEERVTKIEEEGGGSVTVGRSFIGFGRKGGNIGFGRGGGAINFGPGGTRFSGNVSAMGAPIDPRTQRIVPTPGVTEKVEIWVSFLIDGHGVNAAGFCKEASRETRRFVQEMTDLFSLS
jgi:hypothetical protein